MGNLELRRATLADVQVLAAMNQHLIQDERSRNPMSLAELEARMHGWLSGDWSAILIAQAGEVVGYALYQERRDSLFPEQIVIYLRQFFIARSHRRGGIGRAVMTAILADWFPPSARIELDVLEANPVGHTFWRSLGFAPYATTYQRPPAGR